jgi:hypothetical protein
MVMGDMGQNRTPSPTPGTAKRGRPPKPDGPVPQFMVQRAYRARLAAAGKVVRIVDAQGGGEAVAAAPLHTALQTAHAVIAQQTAIIAALKERNAVLTAEVQRLTQLLHHALDEATRGGRRSAWRIG